MIDLLLVVLAVWIALNAVLILAVAGYVGIAHRAPRLALKWVPLAAAASIMKMASVPLVPIAVALMRRAGERPAWVESGGELKPAHVPAYRVPRRLRWLETHDDQDGLLPGGTYEPQVRRIYQGWGPHVASIYWLWRNRAYRGVNALGNVRRFGRDGRYVTTGPVVLMFEPDVPVAFLLRLRWRWPGGKFFDFKAGWKLVDLADGDGTYGLAAGTIQRPSIRPWQSE